MIEFGNINSVCDIIQWKTTFCDLTFSEYLKLRGIFFFVHANCCVLLTKLSKKIIYATQW